MPNAPFFIFLVALAIGLLVFILVQKTLTHLASLTPEQFASSIADFVALAMEASSRMKALVRWKRLMKS